MSSPWKDAFESSLPKQFDFYHMGKVERLGRSLRPEFWNLQDCAVLQFKVYSMSESLVGYLYVFIHAGLDSSVYTELGNVIASQTSKALSEDKRFGEEFFITPPRTVTVPLVEKMVALGGDWTTLKYRHTLREHSIEVPVLIHTQTESRSARA
jgi:hypothetical protein